MRQALSTIVVSEWRDALMRQVETLHVKGRTKKAAGYYVDFEVPFSLRAISLPLDEEFNKSPPSIEGRHPDGENAIFFLVYVKDGFLSFMEAASTADWPSDEDKILLRQC